MPPAAVQSRLTPAPRQPHASPTPAPRPSLAGSLPTCAARVPSNPTPSTAAAVRYFDAVVDVPDLSMRELQIEKYLRTLRSQESNRFVHISHNELYFMHRLLLKHQDVLAHPAAREELAALPAPPEGKVPKDEDEEIVRRLDYCTPPRLPAPQASSAVRPRVLRRVSPVRSPPPFCQA